MPQPSKKAKPRQWKGWAIADAKGRPTCNALFKDRAEAMSVCVCDEYPWRAILTLTPPAKPRKRK